MSNQYFTPKSRKKKVQCLFLGLFYLFACLFLIGTFHGNYAHLPPNSHYSSVGEKHIFAKISL